EEVVMSRRFNKAQYAPDIIIENGIGQALLAASTTVPADATAGYAPGCIYYDTDATVGSQVWINEGTASSSVFRPVTAFGGGRGTVVAAGSTLTLTAATHRGKTIAWDTLTGSVVTLPAATGTGDLYRLVVTVLATSNSHIAK